MPNPQAHFAGQPAMILNPGITVGMIPENNLKLTCFYLCYKEHVLHTVITGDVTRDNVHALKDHKLWEEEHEDVDSPEINSQDWPCTIEAIDLVLCYNRKPGT